MSLPYYLSTIISLWAGIVVMAGLAVGLGAAEKPQRRTMWWIMAASAVIACIYSIASLLYILYYLVAVLAAEFLGTASPGRLSISMHDLAVRPGLALAVFFVCFAMRAWRARREMQIVEQHIEILKDELERVKERR